MPDEEKEVGRVIMNLTRYIHMLRLNMRLKASKRADYLRKKDIFGLIGENVAYSPRHVPLYPKMIRVHNNVNLAAGVRFITHDVSDNMINNKLEKEGKNAQLSEMIGCIEIMDNVFVGANTTILYNVRIGSNVIIGAGSLINKDIPDNVVAAGVPARVIGSFDDFVERRIKWGGYTMSVNLLCAE